eukprot:30443-Pelagococcus_subviridis.AAC.9
MVHRDLYRRINDHTIFCNAGSMSSLVGSSRSTSVRGFAAGGVVVVLGEGAEVPSVGGDVAGADWSASRLTASIATPANARTT